jgi:chromosome segregation protein
MKVKRLEIQGFKSFKDKTVLHFDDGVTGIVGPNGCGKSNIVDSFFWVMGEQSTKHLRGTTSGDLIFSGSEKYAPGSMAEVTMVLSTGAPKEEDLPAGTSIRDLPAHMRFPEISITRRLFRSGESEYLINGQTCRLKDIHELFMDTGAGPKAYSIIEQGQISKIVASKPEDRRVLVEEAAGITKFKARKKESLRKIEAAQSNLARINDIVSEIERQLASLERQAAKARQYKNYKEELRDKELFVGRKRIWTLRTKVQDLQNILQESEAHDASLRSQLDTAQLQAEALKLDEAQAARSADDVLAALQIMQKELSQLQTKLELHKRSIQEVHNASESLESERDDLSQRVQTIAESIKLLNEDSAVQKEIFENAESTLLQHEGELAAARKQADDIGLTLESEKRDLLCAYSKQSEISNQVHGLEARVDGLSVRVSQLSARVSEREIDLEDIQQKVQSLESQHQTLLQQTSDIKADYDQTKESLIQAENAQAGLIEQEQHLRTEITKLESRQATLKQLAENYEGFHSDLKDLLKDPNLSKGIGGVFADSLEAHPGYEYALEAALRDYFETLFIETSHNAKELLQRLKDENKGRISLWALDLAVAKSQVATARCSAQPSAHTSSVSEWGSLPGISLVDVIRLTHARADSLTPFFAKYRVMDSLEQAIEAAQSSPAEAVFVTKEGDTVDGLGRVSGGSTRALETGILSRKAELTQINDTLASLTGEYAQINDTLTAVRQQIAQLKPSLERLTVELKESEIALKSCERDWSSAKQQLDTVTAELLKEKEEKQSLEEERRSLWEKLDGFRQQLVDLERSYKEKQAHIDEKTATFNAAMERCAELQAGLIQLKVSFTSAQEKYNYAQEKLTNLSREASTTQARLDEINRILNSKLNEKDDLQTELMTLEESVLQSVDRVEAQENELRAQKNKLEMSRRSLNETMQNQRVLLKAVEESSVQLNKAKLDLERTQIEFQNLSLGLFERYGLEESTVQHEPAFDDLSADDEAKMLEEVEWLKEKIRKLGEVNVMAVDEYDEQKKRHDFLVTQREDLLKSIEDLEKAIERINKTSEERFKRAFEEINTRFQRIFPLVFGGGAGRLELTNPEDIMETGVEILAQPPGKKIGSIQLMSGGEKALTAVALIFSIFLIKPSPFCVLDEVDAPLDDHNVGKFNMLLKEMAQRSQFIIITHNKRTMELNNKLYGVTMEEPGVSKMVSIEVH